MRGFPVQPVVEEASVIADSTPLVNGAVAAKAPARPGFGGAFKTVY